MAAELGTPEFWEEFGCEGANEYRDCESMSADYARLRRMERRVRALANEWARTDMSTWMDGPIAAESVLAALDDDDEAGG